MLLEKKRKIGPPAEGERKQYVRTTERKLERQYLGTEEGKRVVGYEVGGAYHGLAG